MSNNQIDALENTVKELVELIVLLQNQLSGHTQILKILTDYPEGEEE
jgi:hypothetical protein